MKSILDPLVSYDLARKIKEVLSYSWQVEFVVFPNGQIIAEDMIQDLADSIPCPSLDMVVRYLIKEIGIVVEPVYEYFQDITEPQWRYRVIWIGDKYPVVYGQCSESRDTAISQGIMSALEQIEYERNRN